MKPDNARTDVSVVVSAYEQPAYACFVLEALCRQTLLPAEVLVADDGSSDAMGRALSEIAGNVPFRLVRVWQPDEGFRAARSRNNAIYHARHDAMAFLDQDTLPHRSWLECCVEHLAPGRICIGYILNIPESMGGKLDRDRVKSGEFEEWHDSKENRRLATLQRKVAAYGLLRRLGLGIRGRPAVGFGNVAAWRPDLLNINGFDEEYIGWGQEDDDLGWRLYMAGVRPTAVVNKALVSHIPHPRSQSADNWRHGANIERYRKKRISFRCVRGLDLHPHADVCLSVLRETCDSTA